jgi:hypothetical protein
MHLHDLLIFTKKPKWSQEERNIFLGNVENTDIESES